MILRKRELRGSFTKIKYSPVCLIKSVIQRLAITFPFDLCSLECNGAEAVQKKQKLSYS